MKKQLDFICIGAPKAATSTLFELIEHHPGLYVPPAKEVPFFNDDEIYSKGWDWYMRTFFKDAKPGQLIGTMTPQYMSGFGANTQEVICDRIHDQLPDVKIIALLRHPINRSFSQFKMHTRHGHHTETFDAAVERLLGANLDQERNMISQKNMFLFASEYGRILSYYYKTFPKENILVLFTDDFKKNPEHVLVRLFDFLGLDNTYRPKDIDRESHKGGSQAKIKYLTPAYLKKMPVIDFVWRHFVPITVRKKIFMKITRWNIKPDNSSLAPDSPTYRSLVTFFRDDINLLESVTETKTPWSDWK